MVSTDRFTGAHVAGEADFEGWANEVDAALNNLLTPTSTDLASYYVSCSVDQVLTNSATMTPITELTQTLPGDGGIWVVSYVINYTADATQKASFDMQGPSDADPTGQILANNATAANNAAGTINLGFTTFATVAPAAGFGSSNTAGLRMSALVIIGSTNGDVGPRFKQTTAASATNVTIKQGSFGAVVRVG
jgi:hypothetical protein